MTALALLADPAGQAFVDGLTPTLLARLDAFAAAAAPNSLKAVRSDLAIAASFQRRRGRPPLPLSPLDLTLLLHDEAARGQARASIERLVASLVRVHRLLDLSSPIDETVRLTLKGLRKADPRPPRQAHGLRLKGDVGDLARDAPLPLSLLGLLASLPDDVAGRRDRALLACGYDAGLRRGELAVIRTDQVRPAPSGEGTLLIPRSKTDQGGAGAEAWLSRRTMAAIVAWQAVRPAPPDKSPNPYLFVSLSPRSSPSGHLDPASVGTIVKRRFAAYAATLVAAGTIEPADADALLTQVSGHSLRVGVDQDLIAAGVDIGAIMQALRWASPRQPLAYARHLAARTSKVAATLRAVAP